MPMAEVVGELIKRSAAAHESARHPMADVAGEAIDQLITIEAKNPGMPHNVLRPMYQAARKLVGDRPISIVAAERLVGILAPGDTVLVITGAGYAPTMPKGESDGPPGAASLAKAMYKGLGVVPVYVCEECHVDPIVASSHAAGLMVKDFRHARDRHLGAALTTAPTSQAGVAEWVARTFDEMKPKALISAERLGPGKDGIIHNATGQPLQGSDRTVEHDAVDVAPIVTEANRRAILTIGIGDHGNELGFGSIRDAVVATMPKGDRLCTTIGTEIVLPAMMSNWGCYGIEAALAFLLRRPDLIHSPAQEERIMRACLDAGGLEAMYCTTEFCVDGLDGETSMACMQFLSNIVRKNLESATTGLTH
jgi:hypothetical protein